MDSSFLRYALVVLGLIVASPFLFIVINNAAFRQSPDQVAVREPGEHWLGKPYNGSNEAREDLAFALLSEAAYQRTPDADKLKAHEAIDVDQTLCDMGWTRWMDFPSKNAGEGPQKDLRKIIDGVHLRVEVWSNAAHKQVAVTFGGTVGRNRYDWLSDLRWFTKKKNDEYTVIVKTFGTAFVEEYKRREALPEWDFLRQADLFSTGHSLGGGLAHQFAYALPPDSSVPRVKKVYAFDPSPVTGYYSVPLDLRTNNSKGLKIDRIYERGEILAFFRALVNLVYPPSKECPAIRQVRYNLFYSLNPFAGHSMSDLAFKLDQLCNCREVAKALAKRAS
jgi:hypothetical protein